MKRPLAALAALLAVILLSPSVATAGPAPGRTPSAVDPPAATADNDEPRRGPDRVTDPDARLGPAWRTSTDRAVTTSGDATGLHVLVADESAAYAWRTAATLAEPGFDTDQWIGQACVTGSGRRAVVVYAPRTFTNREVLMQRGGFAAVVDLKTGAVTKLPERVSLAYHNPGCGSGEKVVLSRLEVAAQPGQVAHTWLGTVDTSRPAAAVRTVRAAGQVSSVLPVGDDLIGAKGNSLVRVGAGGGLTRLAQTPGTPFRMLADGRDAVAFQIARDGRTEFKRFAAGRVSDHGSVPLGQVKLRPGAGGRVFAVGGRAESTLTARLPGGWRAVDGLPDADVSTTGALVVQRATTGREAAGQLAERPTDGLPDQVEIRSNRTAGGQELTFSVAPQVDDAGRAPSPTVARRAASTRSPGARTAKNPADPDLSWEPDAACGVSRNDPELQVYQPTVAQMEWAADLAVRNQLTFQRPANWNNNGMAAYSPQGFFPSAALSGGGNVPAQIFLGILAQESNLWQASRHAVDASVGNPLTSLGYYGLDLLDPDFNDINFDEDVDPHPDCGYGAGQVTSGMRVSDRGKTIAGVTWNYTKQKAVATDYATNVAAGLRILQDKWNQTRGAGLIANDGDPRYLENWWFAVWAYNTGFYAQNPQNPSEPWGVGWANNPANTDYPADRKRFLTAPLDVDLPGTDDDIDDVVGYDNAKHPNHWSYPERVIGFAYTSLIRYNYRAGAYSRTYATATARNPDIAHAARYTFCEPQVNDCDEKLPPKVPRDFPDTKPGACQRDDLRCWWHGPVTWTDCATHCGLESRKYTSVEPRPYAEDGDNIHPTPVNGDGSCRVSGLPDGVRIIDDILTSVPLGAEGCTPKFTRGGGFALNFATHTQPDGDVVTPGKVDLHQIGAGFGGHFWFTHTYKQAEEPTYRVTGTWTIDPTNAWTRVWVHLPDHGAHTRQATYVIRRPNGATERRIIPTQLESNSWVNLGVFDFTGAGTPKVELSNFTLDGTGVQDIAWDALAVQPLTQKPRHFVVALGDSYSSGEGTGDYTRVSNQYGDDAASRNSCRRSPNAWSQQATIPGAPGTIAALAEGNNEEIDAQFVACSGATTLNMLSPALLPDGKWLGKAPQGQYGEIAQLDQGSLNENTTAVMFSIGGNDARFTDVGKSCGFGYDCSAPDYYMEGDSKPLRDAERDLITGPVKSSLQEVVRQIRVRAPNARIFVMGYPHLFETPCEYGVVLPGITVGISWDETIFLNELGDLLVNEALPSDAAHGVHGMDPRSEFTGHSLCGDDLYLNGLKAGDAVVGDDGDPKQLFSMESLHPNKDGSRAYARIVNTYMNVYGYRW
ncbi:SGNH/GDSL hydrolase family protein [Micromonospora musae]|uniref:SGNH/GDSL hydrolase family protein n=1 Tax=Micromonospora musae TaxID=1894970 RepID=A0A3A9XTA1_9ACTN|nr:SGNH/GDSL hydrolase family protein [Micromonospora musae]RKN28401.1 SGNH/GDSL hydrolase family protein [Micromonospora musae]